MEKLPSSLDWSLLQGFLAVAETGSLSAAARRLGASQPTVGRQIQTLEAQLGTALFTRQARGMTLTSAGGELMEPAVAMRDAAHRLSLAAAGHSEDMAGTVRLTASVFASHYRMPAIIADLRRLYPEIQIELVASDKAENLLFREADIAVRMFRPQQLDMVTRRIGTMRLGLFGAKTYFEDRAIPTTFDEFLTHEVVGYDRNDDIIRGFREVGIEVDRDFFPVRTDNQTVYWEMVRAGCGLGFAHRKHGLADPDLIEIALPVEIPVLEIWLTAHESVRRSPRVDRVWTFLAERLAEECDEAAPAA